MPSILVAVGDSQRACQRDVCIVTCSAVTQGASKFDTIDMTSRIYIHENWHKIMAKEVNVRWKNHLNIHDKNT